MKNSAASYRYFDTPFIAMAHRGGYLEGQSVARENTIHAFKQAADLGYRYLETDIHASRDGRLVAFHDSVLDRVTDRQGVVAHLSYAELRRARIAGIDQIPGLDEVLEELPEHFINIDIKAFGAIDPLVSTIKRHRAENRICVASFSERRLRAFRAKMGPEVATSLSTLAVAWSAFVPWLPRLANFSGQAFQVPFEHELNRFRLPIVTKKLLRLAKSRGMRVQVWTVNDLGQMRHLLNLGVDGIITDRIEILKAVAVDSGIWQQ